MGDLLKKLKEKKWLWIAGCCALAVLLALLLVRCGGKTGSIPTLTVKTPQKVSASGAEEIALDVTVDHLGEALYPAVSMSIRFDSSKLEFLGVQEGNVFVYDETNSALRQLPEWSCNVQNSNDTGLINIMYLDVTGGKHAFSQALLEEENNVVLRLRFRLRGSARSGDVLELSVEDAVFAASDETQSLAMIADTLKTKNGRVVIGE